MLLLTVAAVVAVPLALELMLAPRLPGMWPALRWGVVPPVGALVGALLPMRVLPLVPMMDALLSLALGALLGGLIAVYGLFREHCFTGLSPVEVARSGRRSAYQGPIRV